MTIRRTPNSRKELFQNNLIDLLPRRNGVIPLPVELGLRDLDRGELFIRDLEASLVGVGVQFGVDPQARLGLRIPDQVHHNGPADQWATTPILRDMAEHAVFDLVPLAGPRGKMAHGNPQPCLLYTSTSPPDRTRSRMP